MIFCNLTAALDPSTTFLYAETTSYNPPCDMTLEGMPMDAPSSKPPRYNQQRVADFSACTYGSMATTGGPLAGRAGLPRCVALPC